MKKTGINLLLVLLATTAFSQMDAQKTKQSPKTQTSDASYKAAIGLKAIVGNDDALPALSGKFFISPNSAVEANISYDGYRGYGVSSSAVTLHLFYQYHGYFNESLKELRWYAGAGPTAGFVSSKNDYTGSESIFRIGGGPIGGAEYKFKNIPLAVSADWMPTYIYVPEYETGAFNWDVAGIGAKYTF